MENSRDCAALLSNLGFGQSRCFSGNKRSKKNMILDFGCIKGVWQKLLSDSRGLCN